MGIFPFPPCSEVPTNAVAALATRASSPQVAAHHAHAGTAVLSVGLAGLLGSFKGTGNFLKAPGTPTGCDGAASPPPAEHPSLLGFLPLIKSRSSSLSCFFFWHSRNASWASLKPWADFPPAHPNVLTSSCWWDRTKPVLGLQMSSNKLLLVLEPKPCTPPTQRPPFPQPRNQPVPYEPLLTEIHDALKIYICRKMPEESPRSS